MSRVVLDSSAVLAVLQQENGRELVLTVADRAVMSAVNCAEVQSKLIRDGMPPDEAKIVVESSVQEVLAFDESQAAMAAALIRQTRTYGLSIGDRACLALATVLAAPVYTADRAWAQLSIGVDVRLVR